MTTPFKHNFDHTFQALLAIGCIVVIIILPIVIQFLYYFIVHSYYLTIQIDSIDAGWALGYMLDQTNSLGKNPSTIVYPYSSADLIVGMLVLTILTGVFVVFFAFTFSACRKSLRPITTGYTNIS